MERTGRAYLLKMIHLSSLFFYIYSDVERECEAIYSGVASEKRGRRPSQLQCERGGGGIFILNFSIVCR